MLVTKPQPHLHPREYFAAPEPAEELGRAPFWTVHVKPRAEKKLARFCEMAGVAHFVPTMLSRREYGNRSVRHSWVPVFPGYVFLLQEAFERVALLHSNAVVQFMRVPRPAELYQDLHNLWMTLVARPSGVEDALFVPGVKEEVVAGALKGVRGELVESRKGGLRLLIKVHLFERAVSVAIDRERVRRL